MKHLLLSGLVCNTLNISHWFIVLILVLSSSANGSEPFECLIEPHLLIDISSSEIGVLASVKVDAADSVEQNDVVAALRTDVENATYNVSSARAQSQSEIELLKREHEYALRKRQRVDELNTDYAISKQDVDEVRTSQSAAKLRFQAASEKQRTAKLEAVRDELALARRIVRSPIDGVVIKKYKNVGEYVDGDPILQLAQLDPLRIRVIVPMDMFGQIKTGMQATVTPELSIEGPLIASVTSIDPMVDAATATLGVRLSLPNPDHRIPAGLKCTLAFLHKNISATDSSFTSRDNSKTSLALTPTATVSTATPALAAAKENSYSQATTVATSEETTSQVSDAEAMRTDNSMMQSSSSEESGGCVSLSSLKDISEFAVISSVLKSGEMRFSYQFDSDENASWTILSQQTYDKPNDLVKRHNDLDTTDVHLITGGVWKGRLSFGVFNSNENAILRLSELQTLGYDVEQMPRFENGAKLRIDVEPLPSNKYHWSIVSRIQEYYPELNAQSVRCPVFGSR